VRKCKIMNDIELCALARAVDSISMVRYAVNMSRLQSGLSLAYDETFPELDVLLSELSRRGVF